MFINILKFWTGPLPIQELFPKDRKVNPFLHWFIHPIKRHLAKYYLWILQTFFGLTVIAITGSTGKTTTTNMLYSVLSLAGSTIKTADSITTTYNLPTTILKCTPQTKYLILEMGVEYPGDMDFYTWLARPDIGTVLNVTSVHSSFLGTLKDIAAEKNKLLLKSRIAIKNTDFAQIKSSLITKSLNTQINAVINHKSYIINLPLLGIHFSHNVSAVLAICNVLKIPSDLVKQGLESVTPPPHRMNVIKLPNGNIILDDTYNANPLSVSESLKTLFQISSAYSLVPVFIFAQMNELGSYEKSAHQQIGRLIKKLTNDYRLKTIDLFCLGPATRHTIASAGFGQYFKNIDQLSGALIKFINHKSSFIILFKGSHSWHLEKIVDRLTSNG